MKSSEKIRCCKVKNSRKQITNIIWILLKDIVHYDDVLRGVHIDRKIRFFKNKYKN